MLAAGHVYINTRWLRDLTISKRPRYITYIVKLFIINTRSIKYM